MVAEDATFKKAILLFDELHFIDRPSFMFGNYGTIATESPLRPYEKPLQENGVPLFIHKPHSGPVVGEFLEQVKADVNDPEFLRRFQAGLTTSLVFRDHQIPPGNYGEVGNQEDVTRSLVQLDLDTVFNQYDSPMDLISNAKIEHFRFRNDAERAKRLASQAMACSAVINFALNVGQSRGMIPMADAGPYQDLLGAKYARAARQLEGTDSRVQVTDLGFAIFDALLPAERLAPLTFGQLVDYRKESGKAREAFLEHLSALQGRLGDVGSNGDYSGTIKDIINSDILDAARTFKNDIDSIFEKLYGKLLIGALGFLGGGPAALQYFGGLSWPHLLSLAGVAGTALGGSAIEAKLGMRSAKRECAISYVLGLDKERKI
jgi:hypothetical protein